MIAASPARVSTRVIAAQAAPPQPTILAGALDAPLPGEILPGGGVEISGWVIPTPGHTVSGVFTVVEGERGPLHALDVGRPDVATDYPALPSPDCGFAFWCPLPERERARVQLVCAFASGEMAPLLDLYVSTERESPGLAPGHRVVTAPDFVIIGAQRGGTTSLHAYLSAHREIRTPAKKEIHYLTDRHARGADWYIGQFPPTVPAGALVGEATPYALFHPLAPRRLRGIAPDARVIALLRNPVDRAYSHYRHERARGHEHLSFEAALAAEPARLEGLEAKLAAGELPASDAHKCFSYAARGRYAGQLARWLDVFPREQVLILRSEDLYDAPALVTRQVTDFLGLPPLTGVPFAAHNATSGPPMQRETRIQLRNAFAPDNEYLARILGKEPGWD